LEDIVMFSKIVVGLDGSDQSTNALKLACDVAQKYGSELHIVHTPKAETVAFALGAVAGYHAVTTLPDAATVKEAAEKVLNAGKDIAKTYKLPKVETHIGATDPADDVIDCAKKCGADLIVSGRRGLGAIKSAVLGSTSQRIAHLADCAHLTVA
jgi:nucleotide-binding universal stress UspA family protein